MNSQITLIYIEENQKELLNVISQSVKNNISFEFMNNKELYFFIYDEEDFNFKKSILGEKIINLKNKVN
jgi:hypothetical protein